MFISEKSVTEARNKWGEGILEISKAFEFGGIYKATNVATNMLDNLYGFHLGPVLFKPTLSGGSQTFRPTKKGALSYFIGQNSEYPMDTGFGIKPWRKVKFHSSAVFLEEKIALWMGWVTFVDREGKVTKVDKSWGYKLDIDGGLKIIQHHSSLPYEA